MCDNLEEIRLNNCGIQDEGAINIFEELNKIVDSKVNTIELSQNKISENSFEALVILLESNSKVGRVDLSLNQVEKEFGREVLSDYGQRVIF